jgi:hypothetical protein
MNGLKSIYPPKKDAYREGAPEMGLNKKSISFHNLGKNSIRIRESAETFGRTAQTLRAPNDLS